MAPMSPVPAARSVSSRMRTFPPAVNVWFDNSGLAAAGAGTTVGLRPSSVPAPAAACASTTLLGMTTRQFSYALKSKLPGDLCLIIIGTEGSACNERGAERMTQLKDGGRQPSNREEQSLSASTVIARWQGNGWDEPCKSRGLRTVLWAAGGEIPPADPASGQAHSARWSSEQVQCRHEWR